MNDLAFISWVRISRYHDSSLTLYLESVLMTEINDCTFQDNHGGVVVVVGILVGWNIMFGDSLVGGESLYG